MPHPHEDLIRRLYEARAGKDRAAVRALLTDDIRWHDPYPAPFGGDFEGAEAVMEFLFGTLETEMADSGLELHDVVANERHAIALVNWWAVLGGRRIDGREIGVYHLSGGKVTEVWFTTDDKQASDAFFSNPR